MRRFLKLLVYSVIWWGMAIRDDGTITGIIHEARGYKAGFMVGDIIKIIDGRLYNPRHINAATTVLVDRGGHIIPILLRKGVAYD